MRIETLQTFAQLCESLTEASTAMDIVTKNPGGAEVVKYLHKNLKLAHDLPYTAIDKISWSALKNMYHGAWVIIKGSKGTGAIKAKNDAYEAIASSGAGVEEAADGRGGNILDFLKERIGKLESYYVAANSSDVTDKQSQRKKQKAGAGPTAITQDTLVLKFKPLWLKAMNAAMADVKGYTANLIKNDAFEKAERKLEHIKSLQSGIDSIESGSEEVPQFIKSGVHLAVLMAASHHYPEQTGDINRGYRGYGSTNSEGPRLLLADIANGDTAKLGTILGFFKKALISG